MTFLEVNCDIFKQASGNNQKQPYEGVLITWCSENMQQIYRRAPHAEVL